MTRHAIHQNAVIRVLQLRYGTQSPTRDTRKVASMAVVAKYLNLGLNSIKCIIQKYFKELEKNQMSERTFSEQLEKCFEQNYLEEAATLNLKERAARATMVTNIEISQYKLRAEYRKRGIKKKRVIKRSANTTKYTPDVLRQLVIELNNQIDLAEKEGYELFFIDESFFFGQDRLRTAWSCRNKNLVIKEESKDQKKVGVMGAISAKSGHQLCHLQVNKFFNASGTVHFLKDLVKENRQAKIAVLWDNASIHKSRIVKEFIQNKNIKSIMNVPYCPQYNAIEILWALAKQKFRKLISRKKIDNKLFNVARLVQKSLRAVKSETTLKICQKTLKLINEKQDD